jgi:hypothetical protein
MVREFVLGYIKFVKYYILFYVCLCVYVIMLRLYNNNNNNECINRLWMILKSELNAKNNIAAIGVHFWYN